MLVHIYHNFPSVCVCIGSG